MELPFPDLLYSQLIQLWGGLVKLARVSWDGLGSHRPKLGSEEKGSPEPSLCYKKHRQAVLLTLYFSTKKRNSSRQC